MLAKSSVFFWVAKFCTKDWVQRIFLGAKKQQSCHILEQKKGLKSPYFDNIFFKAKQDPKKKPTLLSDL
jgi:hypothetical protein